ncbi:MAG: glycosyltransferase, partial [Thiohalocapsa sp.]
AAQTAACLLTPRSVFEAQGMFDEGPFAVAYNDCDYGFKLTNAGLRNVYCANALLYHHEGYSRGVGRGNDKPSEEGAFVRKYASWVDPFYNPNLALGQTDFAVRPVSVVTTPVPRLRVALVTHNLDYEGAPRVLSDIGLGLQRFVSAEVIVVSPKDGALRALYENHGCEVHVVPTCGDVFRSDTRGLDAVSTIAAFFVQHRIDIIVANTVLCWWGIEAAAMVRSPSLWVIHESEPPFTHLAEHSTECARRGRRALALPYRVVFVAEATRAVFADLETRENFAVYHNGYDASESAAMLSAMSKPEAKAALELPRNAIIGLLPGTVCERKSQVDLIHAIKVLPVEALRRLHFVILGDRPSEYSARLHAEIAKLEQTRRDTIAVVDHCPGAELYFRAADFMISTSRIEAFPRVVQEAMLFELPMVVAPVNGIQEQVQDEVSALFYPSGDTTSLARQIERIVAEPGLRHRLGTNARATLDRFPSVDEMVKFYASQIEQAWLSAR